jgi:hypothetical protein
VSTAVVTISGRQHRDRTHADSTGAPGLPHAGQRGTTTVRDLEVERRRLHQQVEAPQHRCGQAGSSRAGSEGEQRGSCLGGEAGIAASSADQVWCARRQRPIAVDTA